MMTLQVHSFHKRTLYNGGAKRKPQPQSGIENPSRSRRSLAVVARMKKTNDHAERQKSNAKKNKKNKKMVLVS